MIRPAPQPGGLLLGQTRSRTQWSEALQMADDEAFRNRLAAGLTYTTQHKLLLTLEYDYNGAAFDEDNWNALMRGSALTYGQYRQGVQYRQALVRYYF